MGHCNRKVAKCLCDPVCRITVSVTRALAEKGNRLLPFEDANRQRKPSQTVPIEVACGGDDDPNSTAFRGKTYQVVEILHVVEDEKAVRRIC